MRINENSSPFFCNADSCSDFNFTALNGKQHYCAIRTTTYWRKEKFLCSHFPPHISHESFFLLAVVISKRDDRADDDDNVGNFECMQKPCSVCVFMSGFYTNADREAE